MAKKMTAQTALGPFFLCVVLFFASVSFADISPEFVKESFPKLQVEKQGEKGPSWKLLWDEARHAFHQGQMQQAKMKYQELLLKRPRLDEARWENVLVAIYLHQWNDAESHLRTLLDSAPDTTRYLILLADILCDQGQKKKAAELYEKILRQPLTDTIKANMLRSLSSLYLELKQESKAFVALEELFKLEPADSQVRLRLGMLAFSLKKYEKARGYLEILATSPQPTSSLLSTLARIYQHLQLDNLAANYWQQVLEKKPDDVQAHLFLAAFYLKKNDIQKAISSYESLEKAFPANTAYQKKLAFLHLKSGRPDKSLPLLEKYLENNKDDLSAQKTLQQIRMAMASDLLAIVENEGAMALWKDLTRLTPNRYALYRSMASLLRKKKKWTELLDVLEIMYSQNPNDTSVQEQLARIYLDRHDLSRARRFYNLLALKGYSSKDFYQGRATLNILEEKPEAALKDFESLLDLLPKQYEARAACIKIAASLGLATPFLRHLEVLQKQTKTSLEAQALWTDQSFQMQVAHGFAGMGFYSRALTIYRSIMLKRKETPDLKKNLTGGAVRRAMAETFAMAGLSFEAQKVLRQGIYEQGHDSDDLLLLARFARDENRLDAAEKWVQIYQERISPSAKTAIGHDKGVFMEALLAEARGDNDQSIQLLQTLENAYRPKVTQKKGPSSFYLRVAKELMRLYIVFEKKNAARRLHQRLVGANLQGPLLLPFTLALYKFDGEGRKREELLLHLATKATNDLGALVAITKSFKESGDLHLISSLMNHQKNTQHRSLHLLFLHVESLMEKGSMTEALVVVQKAIQRFHDNDRLLRLEVTLLLKVKKISHALARAEKLIAVRNELWPHRDLLLVTARSYFLRGKLEKAHTIVTSILRPSVDKILEDLLKKEGIASTLMRQSRSVWQVLPFFQTAPRSVAAILFEPPESGDETMSGARRIAAPYYDLYRWQKLFQSEFSDMN